VEKIVGEVKWDINDMRDLGDNRYLRDMSGHLGLLFVEFEFLNQDLRDLRICRMF